MSGATNPDLQADSELSLRLRMYEQMLKIRAFEEQANQHPRDTREVHQPASLSD